MTQEQQQSAEEAFGAEVRRAREGRGWTQEQLRRALQDATGVELSATAMARLEQGKRPIRLNEVAALAQVLGLALEQYSGTGTVNIREHEYEHAKKSIAALLQRGVDLEQEYAVLMEKRAELDQRVYMLQAEREMVTRHYHRLAKAVEQYERTLEQRQTALDEIKDYVGRYLRERGDA